jgi:phage-related baseplate assembly protein
MMQDLTRLQNPSVIEPLEYETIFAHMKQELIRLDPTFSALLESDPAMKILEIAAWRELLLRQRVNDAARANLLAFAAKSDLEHLAAFYDVQRKSEENDEAFRRRIQAKIMGWSTAGSREHYRYHALSADIRIKDARAESPSPGIVKVSILSREGDGTPSQELLEKARFVILRDDVRVLTDTVEVVSSGIIPVKLEAKIYLYPETPEDIVEIAKTAFIKALNETKGLGWNLTRSWIIAHLFAQGVQRIDLLNPLQDLIVQDHECIALENIHLEIGGRDW